MYLFVHSNKMLKLVWSLLLLTGVLQSSATSIREGSVIDIKQFPSIAQVEVRVGVIWTQQCAATIITNYHVISLASCFYGLYLPEYRRIRVGSSKRNSGGEIIEVKHAHVHPNFGLLGNDADIAVIQLREQIILNNHNIATIGIISQNFVLPSALPVSLYGWGKTVSNDDDLYYDLKTRGLFIQSESQCAEKYSLLSNEEEPIYFTENMICFAPVGAAGVAFDSRDYGDPITYSNILTAIVSFGDESGDLPVVGTAISSYTDWIIEKGSIIA